jgi:hypothetical protein
MVSEHDRASLRRQAAALDAAPYADEGSLAWRAELSAWVDAERRAAGRAELDSNRSSIAVPSPSDSYAEFHELLSA